MFQGKTLPSKKIGGTFGGTFSLGAGRYPMLLTDIKLRSAKPKDKPYKLSDSGGLFLFVTSGGAKYWRMKYRFGGKEKLLAIGVYPEISLAEAREGRDLAKKQIANGIDPSSFKKATKRSMKLSIEGNFEFDCQRMAYEKFIPLE